MTKHADVFKPEIDKIKEFFNKLEKTPGMTTLELNEDGKVRIHTKHIRSLSFKNYHDLFDSFYRQDRGLCLPKFLDIDPSIVTDFKRAILIDDIINEVYYDIPIRTIKGGCVLLEHRDGTSDLHTKDEYIEVIKKLLTDRSIKNKIKRYEDLDFLFKDFIKNNSDLKKLNEELNSIVRQYYNKLERLDCEGKLNDLDVKYNY
jgi:hypothetical protein